MSTQQLTLFGKPLVPAKIETLFDQFWMVYPPRRGSNPKKPAKEKFCGLVRKGVDPQDIIAGARRYAETRVGEDARFTAMAQTFLNQHRWADDYTFEPNPPKTFAELAEELSR
jgi:hypothetical protein